MNKRQKNLLLILAVPALLYLMYTLAFPVYSWNQKLTVEVETPQGVISGSSVVQPRLEMRIRIGSIGGSYASWQGEATIVALPNNRFLFVLLGRPLAMAVNSFKETILGSPDARILKGEPYYSKLEDLRESAPLTRERYPLFVTFGDLDDPASVKVVDPDDLAATFGSGYALKSVTLEITDEEVTRGEVEKVLKWIYSVSGLMPKEMYPKFLKDRTPEHNVKLTGFIDGPTLFKK